MSLVLPSSSCCCPSSSISSWEEEKGEEEESKEEKERWKRRGINYLVSLGIEGPRLHREEVGQLHEMDFLAQVRLDLRHLGRGGGRG